MPTNYIKKLHDENKGSIAELESKWSEAKAQAEKQGQGTNYAYVTSIFKKMVGASPVFADLKLNGHGRIVARDDKLIAKCGGPMVGTVMCAVCADEMVKLSASLLPPELGASERLLATSTKFFAK